MIALDDEPVKDLLADKEALLKAFDAVEKRLGFEYVPGASAQEARRLMRAAGIRAEDNILSSEMLRERYPDDPIP